MKTLGAIFSACALEAEAVTANALAPRRDAIRLREENMTMKRAVFVSNNHRNPN
jgi:hypothetical protein